MERTGASREEENRLVLDLVQAMIGAISDTFRRVTIEVGKERVLLRFLLEREDDIAREEIDDIAFEFEALQERDLNTEVVVMVDARPMADLALPGRVVFGRREAR